MTREDTTHNGWTNYATWRVNLEICDDYLISRAEDVGYGHADKWRDTISLADELQDTAEQAVSGWGELDDNKSASLALSYAQAFLSDVNWYEIAATFRADNPDLFEAEDE